MSIQKQNLRKRVLTGCILAAALILLLVFSHHFWVMDIYISVLSILGVTELRKAVGQNWSSWFYRAMVLISISISWISIPGYGELTGLAFIASVVFTIYLFVKLNDDSAAVSISDVAGVLLGLEVPFFYRAIYEIRVLDSGLFHLTAAVIVWAATDIAAYFVGSKWGSTPLAPDVSPHKTLEGSIGGIAAAVIFLVLIALILSLIFGFPVYPGRIWIYSLTASVIGQLGDLSMSAIKRAAGIKDFGNLLPGHGGILDRFDSLLYILPSTYLFCWIAGPLATY